MVRHSAVPPDGAGNQTGTAAEYKIPTDESNSSGSEEYGIGFDSVVEVSINEYNGLNQLVNTTNIKDGTRTFASYVYNGDGLRVQKTVDGTTTDYTYSGSYIIAETGKTYLRGLSYHAVTQSGTKYYYFSNAHGDITNVVNSSKVTVAAYDYDEFGNLTEETGTFESSFRYAGEYYDIESGNYYLRSRYYDPTIGRFTQQDSFLGYDDNPLSLNRYTYCHNNPIRFVDPSGHETANVSVNGVNYSWNKQMSFAQDQALEKVLSSHQRGEINSEQFLREMNYAGITTWVTGGYVGGGNGSSSSSNFIPAEDIQIIFDEQLSLENSVTAASLMAAYDEGRLNKDSLIEQLDQLSYKGVIANQISACIDSVHYNVWIPYLAGLYGGTAIWNNSTQEVSVSVGGKTAVYKNNSTDVTIRDGKMYVCTDRFFDDFNVPNIFSWYTDAEYGYAAYINLDENNRKYRTQLYGVQTNTDYSGKYKVLSGEVVNDILIGSTYQDEYYFYGASSDRVLAFCYPLTEQNKITNNVYYADIGSLGRNGYGDGENYVADFIATRMNVAKDAYYISQMMSRDRERTMPLLAGYMSVDILNGTFIVSNEFTKKPVTAEKVRNTIPDAMPNNVKVTGKVGSMPPRSIPNSSMEVYSQDGELLQRRIFGADGRAMIDVDFSHANANGSHTFPHIHEWDWSKVPPRQ